jgi:hypothetical protein
MRGIPDFADAHPGYEALGPRFRGDERTSFTHSRGRGACGRNSAQIFAVCSPSAGTAP